MSFISNANHFSLGDGVYNNVAGDLNIIHNTFYGPRKRNHYESDESDGGLPQILQ